MRIVISMYVTLAPVIFAGVLNMIWCKLPFLLSINKPIDGGIILSDNRRLFGDNKTWKGLIGYVVLNALSSVLWGLIVLNSQVLSSYNWIYVNNNNTIPFNLVVGILLGVAYALFELPNSFLKRRLDIEPGKTTSGPKRVLFIILDQADSLFGCVLVICIFYKLSLLLYFAYVAIGALTHIILNMILYLSRLRKNPF